MKPREKIWAVVLISAILGLAFLSGQVFFYSRRGAAPLLSPVPVSSLGAGLLSYARAQAGLTLAFGEKKFDVNPQEFKTWIESYTRSYTGREEQRISREKIQLHLKNLSQEIDTAPIDARFSIGNGKITEFSAPRNGRLLNIPESLRNVISALAQNTHSSSDTSKDRKNIELVVDEIESQLTLDKVNNLGINTLLGRGESDFAGSPSSRIHNISVGSEIFNGMLLKPGQEFSFNQLLGPVDASGGYLPELVIKNGKIMPEFGGGLCQVSTTIFRAATAAGLAILERHPHSLPVHYYNPQGFDATVYPGVSDFRFKNDTPAHILIQSKVVGSKLYFEIYGTLDGRKTAIDGPHQYDIKSNGALRAVLTRTITYADETEKKDVFYSSYQSPSASPTVRNPLE